MFRCFCDCEKQSNIYYIYSCYNFKHDAERLYIASSPIENDNLASWLYDESIATGILLCQCANLFSDILKMLHKVYNQYDYLEIANEIKWMIYKSTNHKWENSQITASILETMLYDTFCCENPECFDIDNIELDYLISYMSFLELCSKNKKYHNMDSLRKFSTILGRPLKNSFALPHESLSVNIARLSPNVIEYYFDKFDETTKDGAIFFKYYNYYPIYNLADLIEVLLQQLFISKHSICKCGICNKFFIPKQSNARYCNTPNPKYNNCTCRYVAKLQSQKYNSETCDSHRMHRSIAQMLRTEIYKFNDLGDEEQERITEDKYFNFLDESKEWRNKVKNRDMAEWQYVRWLKTFYKRKYK